METIHRNLNAAEDAHNIVKSVTKKNRYQRQLMEEIENRQPYLPSSWLSTTAEHFTRMVRSVEVAIQIQCLAQRLKKLETPRPIFLTDAGAVTRVLWLD